MLKREDFENGAQEITCWITDYFKNLESFPVKSQVKPGEIYNTIPPTAPMNSEGLEQILADLDDKILPGITHWQHPDFYAYFPRQ